MQPLSFLHKHRPGRHIVCGGISDEHQIGILMVSDASIDLQNYSCSSRAIHEKIDNNSTHSICPPILFPRFLVFLHHITTLLSSTSALEIQVRNSCIEGGSKPGPQLAIPSIQPPNIDYLMEVKSLTAQSFGIFHYPHLVSTSSLNWLVTSAVANLSLGPLGLGGCVGTLPLLGSPPPYNFNRILSPRSRTQPNFIKLLISCGFLFA